MDILLALTAQVTLPASLKSKLFYCNVSKFILFFLKVLGDSDEMDTLKATMEEKFMANNPSKVCLVLWFSDIMCLGYLFHVV